MIKYMKISGNEDCNFVRVSVAYNKGGKNVWTGKEVKRGYYANIVPVKRERNLETFGAFTGVNLLLFETARQSKKQEEMANKMGFDMNTVGRYVNGVAHGEVSNVWCD